MAEGVLSKCANIQYREGTSSNENVKSLVSAQGARNYMDSLAVQRSV